MTGPDAPRPYDGHDRRDRPDRRDGPDAGAGARRDSAPHPPEPVPGEVRDYRKSGQMAIPRRRPPPAPRRPHRVRWLLLLAVVASVAWAMDVAYAPAPVAEPLPGSVRGVWRTDVPRYRDRRFELRADSVFFQVGPETSMFIGHRIVRVSQSATPEGRLFRIDYLEESSDPRPLTLSFFYRSGGRPEIVLAAQKTIVWVRESGPGAVPR